MSKQKRKIPPGIGLIALLRIMKQLRQRPLQTFMELWQQFGDVFSYHGLFTMYQLHRPEHAEYVMQTNNKNYRKGRSFALLKSSIGDGLLVSDGDSWLQQRRLAQPAFHRQRIAGFARIMADATLEMVERWRSAASQDEPLEVNSEMMRLTLGIVGRTLFSTDLSRDADWVGQALGVIREHIVRRSFATVRLPESFPTRQHREFRKAVQTSDDMVYGLVAERRSNGKNNGAGDDLLGMLMSARDEETGEGMTDKQLRDEAMTIIAAGYETITQALSWTWYLLSKHPDVERRLHEELEVVLGGRAPVFDDLQKLTYTRMVFEEAMRLYPPIYGIMRTANAEDEIGGYYVPANTEIFICPYITHRHPEFWDNPEDFDPERFSPEAASARPHYAYFPFGGGPRQCIGNSFAMMEAQVIIATVAQNYRLELVPGYTVEPEASVTLRPRYGIMMKLRQR
ncbi:MAG TPA: cytochrome P450 [Pyrinomonadaceae bacterium]